MAGNGPAPKHPSVRARRNNAKAGFRLLPTSGRAGLVPVWPLLPPPALVARLESLRDQVAQLQVAVEAESDAWKRGQARRKMEKLALAADVLALEIEQAADSERALWAELWTFPQAVMWEETRSHRSVALYVRCQIRGEQGDLRSAVEARQREDRLGLNDLALLRLRAEVEKAEEAEVRGAKRRQSRKPPKEDGGDPRDVLHVVN